MKLDAAAMNRPLSGAAKHTYMFGTKSKKSMSIIALRMICFTPIHQSHLLWIKNGLGQTKANTMKTELTISEMLNLTCDQCELVLLKRAGELRDAQYQLKRQKQRLANAERNLKDAREVVADFERLLTEVETVMRIKKSQ